MKHFKNILLIDDQPKPHPETLRRAVNLAADNKGKLTFVIVIDESHWMALKLANKKAYVDYEKALRKEFLQEARKNLDKSKIRGLNISIEIMTGVPYMEIIQSVLEHQFDLVMVTQNSKHACGAGTILKLLRKCPAPVLAVAPSRREIYKKIMVAVDVSPEDNSLKKSLNNELMKSAMDLARIEKSELHILFCWDCTFEGQLRYARYVSDAQVKKAIADVRDMHAKWFKDFVKSYDLSGIAFKSHLVKGAPGDMIPKKSAVLGIDILIMGTVCRKGLAGFFVGNTAEMVFSKTKASLLAIKPAHFCSPVKKKKS